MDFTGRQYRKCAISNDSEIFNIDNNCYWFVLNVELIAKTKVEDESKNEDDIKDVKPSTTHSVSLGGSKPSIPKGNKSGKKVCC